MGCQSPAWPVCMDDFVLIASGLFYTSSVDVLLHQQPELRSSRECSQHSVQHQAFRGPVCQHLTEAKLGGGHADTPLLNLSLNPKLSQNKSKKVFPERKSKSRCETCIGSVAGTLSTEKKSMSLEMYWQSLPQNKAWRKHGSEEEGET